MTGSIAQQVCPAIRLVTGSFQLAQVRGLKRGKHPRALPDPGLLVSYWYHKSFERHRHTTHFRDWVLDSGAFSADQCGAKIDLVEYTEYAMQELATDPLLTEVYALDVIGDSRMSRKHTEWMTEQGVQVVPTFHQGSKWPELISLCKEYPKVALGNMVGAKGKDEWIGQCFARVWPKKLHGFGVSSSRLIMKYPFHSVDASTWCAPCMYGRWPSFGNTHWSMRIKTSEVNLRPEVDRFLRIERAAQSRWHKEMQLLETL